MEHFIIYTDGGARGNPGPAGAGAAIYDASGKTILEVSEYLGDMKTNNEAEYEAVILALRKLKSAVGAKRAKEARAEFRMDSELLVRQLNGRYKIREERLKILFADVWNARLDYAEVSFTHVPREQNKEADRLVNTAINLHIRRF
jgi:ribonuclease HI